MTYTFMTEAAAHPVPGQFAEQKFGRIELVRSLPSGAEIDIRQPNGCLMTVLLGPKSIDTGASEIQIGRNIWISGQIEGSRMKVGAFSVYAEEL